MKSILLHIYDDTGLETRLQATLDLARAMGSHITCLHATPFEDYLAADPLIVAVLPEEFSGKMKRRRLELQSRVEARLRTEGVTWEWVHVNEAMLSAIIRHSALADIIVLSFAGPALMKHEPRPLAAAVAMHTQVAVLAVPEPLNGIQVSAPALIAWNGSPEAAAALRAALPLLKLASVVSVLEVQDRSTRYTGDLAVRYLGWHGVKAENLQRAPIDGSVSATIATAAAEFGSGVIVMGAYGHSRMREWLLGGVTRDLLSDSPVPLLLAH